MAHRTAVSLKLELRDGQLVAEIHDDGRGFRNPIERACDGGNGRGGNGLGNMRLCVNNSAEACGSNPAG